MNLDPGAKGEGTTSVDNYSASRLGLVLLDSTPSVVYINAKQPSF